MGTSKGGSTAPTPIFTAPPAAPAAQEAATQEEVTTPEEEMKQTKEAQKMGAKSLQIPISGGATESSTVGTV